jgi:acyl-CoA synthetase (AMP-forming)/AMP-acid ligase II/thioester reductase-like protein
MERSTVIKTILDRSDSSHVLTLFLSQVLDTPSGMAMETPTRRLSYAELFDAVWRVYNHLDFLMPGSRIVCHCHKSWEAVVAMVAIWLRGAIYIPIDESSPSSSREHIYSELNPFFLLNMSQLREYISTPHSSSFLLEYPQLNSSADAYILYTSGSSGPPKGALLTHKGLTNVITEQIRVFELSSNSRGLLYYSIFFDASLSDILTLLCSGGCLVIDDQCRESISSLVQCSTHFNITHLDLPPSILPMLAPADIPTLSCLILGGERCASKWIAPFLDTCRVVGVYGVTEASICSSMHVYCADSLGRYSIGRPITGVEYIVHGDNSELCIAGEGVAKGYVSRAQLTSERFSMMGGQRLFFTGDQVAYDARIDDYVISVRLDRSENINGRLIYPEEIERTLLLNNTISQAAVVCNPATSRIYAWGVPKRFPVQGLERALLNYCQANLPDFLVPNAIFVLPSLPLNSHSKVDYEVLKELIPEREMDDIVSRILSSKDDELHGTLSDWGLGSLELLTLLYELEKQGIFLPPDTLNLATTLLELKTLISEPPSEYQSTSDIKDEISDSLDCARRWLYSAPEESVSNLPEPEIVLVLGATGSLGVQVLISLLKETDSQVVALIRAEDDAHAVTRLNEVLSHYNLPSGIGDQIALRVRCVAGDAAEERFSLTEDCFRDLGNAVSTIYHCAGSISPFLSFSDHFERSSAMMWQLLRFMEKGCRKSMKLASSLSIFVHSSQGEEPCLEATPLDSIPGLYGAYAQDKWAIERLVDELCLNGWPIIRFRFGLLTPELENGTSHRPCMFSDYLKMASVFRFSEFTMKNSVRVDITPLNIAASIMGAVSASDKFNVYHVASDSGVSLSDISGEVSKWSMPRFPVNYAKLRYLNIRNFNQKKMSVFLGMDLFLSTGYYFDKRHLQAVGQCPVSLHTPKLFLDRYCEILSGRVKQDD